MTDAAAQTQTPTQTSPLEKVMEQFQDEFVQIVQSYGNFKQEHIDLIKRSVSMILSNQLMAAVGEVIEQDEQLKKSLEALESGDDVAKQMETAMDVMQQPKVQERINQFFSTDMTQTLFELLEPLLADQSDEMKGQVKQKVSGLVASMQDRLKTQAEEMMKNSESVG